MAEQWARRGLPSSIGGGMPDRRITLPQHRDARGWRQQPQRSPGEAVEWNTIAIARQGPLERLAGADRVGIGPVRNHRTIGQADKLRDRNGPRPARRDQSLTVQPLLDHRSE